MTILLTLVCSTTLAIIAVEMDYQWRRRRRRREFRDYIRRTYGRDGDKKYWYEPGNPSDR